MNKIILIPARAGSKGIPSKNIKKLGDKPLIHYTIKEAIAVQKSDPSWSIIVSSDSSDILCYAQTLDKKIVLDKRPDVLSQDKSTMTELVEYIKDTYSEGHDSVLFCLLQPTSPLRKAAHVIEAIAMVYANPDHDLVSVQAVKHTMTPLKILKASSTSLICSSYNNGSELLRRQDIEEHFYARNGAIYIFRYKQDFKVIPVTDCLYYQMDQLSSLDIDDISDWILCEALLQA